MKKIKKIISILLCLAMLPISVVTFAEEKEQSVDLYSERISKLADFGVVSGYALNTEDFKRPITRADLAAMAVLLLNIDDVTSGKYVSDFYDVPGTHWATSYIEICRALGIVSDNSEHKFYPDAQVGKNEAIKVIVSVLGYGTVATHAGGYPDGYLKVAAANNLLKNVSIKKENAVTVEEMLAIIYNAIEVPILKQITFGKTEEYEEHKNVTILSEYFNIYKKEGVVLGNDRTLLSDSAHLGTSQVKIGNDLYNEGITNIADYLGYYVEYYYKKDNSQTDSYIVSFSVKKTETYEVLSDKIEGFSNNTFRYRNESGRAQSLQVSPTVDVIFNGLYKSHYTIQDIMPKNGQVCLIDNNKDGIIEVISVKSYITYYVEKTDASRSAIYDKYDRKPLYLEEKPERNITIYKDNSSVEFSDIAAGQVLTVMADAFTVAGDAVDVSTQAKVITVYITETTVVGLLDSMDKEESIAYIDKAEYSFSNSLLKVSNITKLIYANLGNHVTVALDYFGRIAYLSDEVESKEAYGYLIAGEYSALSAKCLIFDINTNECKMLELAKKVKIDKTTYSNTDALTKLKTDEYGVVSANVIPQLIDYRVDSENKVRRIDTSYVALSENPDLTLTRAGNRGIYRYHSSSTSFGGKFAINNETSILFVPKNTDDTVDTKYTEGFYTCSTSLLSNSVKYDVEAYNMTNGLAKILVAYYVPGAQNNATIAYANRNLAMVEKVVYCNYNDNEAAKISLRRVNANSEFTLYATEETVVAQQVSASSSNPITASELKKGDIVRYITGVDAEEAIRIERVFTLKNADGTRTAPNKKLFLMNPVSDGDYFANYLLTYGILYSNENNFCQVLFNEDDITDTYMYNYNVSNAKLVVLFDEVEDEIRVVTPGELYNYTQTKDYSDAYRVITLTASGSIYAVAAYRLK